MSWTKIDDKNRPTAGTFMVATLTGNDDAKSYVAGPAKTSSSGKLTMWNGEPIPADALYFEVPELPEYKAEQRSGTHVIEDGVDKGELQKTRTDAIIENRNLPDALVDTDNMAKPAKKASK